MEYKKKGEKPLLKIYKDPRSGDNLNPEIPGENIIRKTVKQSLSIPEPPFWGTKIVSDIQIEKAFEYINEIALFRGSWNVYKDRKKTDEEYDQLIENEILPKFKEQKLKAKREKLLEPLVIYGYFPCKSDGNSLSIYKPKDMKEDSLYGEWEAGIDKDNLVEWVSFSFPRQKKDKFLCISDYFREKDSDSFDVVPFFIVTVGQKATEYAQMLYDRNLYQDYLYFHGLSVETAEGLAEYWHKIIRKELGIGGGDSDDIKKIFQQGYQGSRFSFGYPACPNLEDNKKLFEILKPERIGITLTEEWQMVPEQSTNALVVHHPEAKYFFIK